MTSYNPSRCSTVVTGLWSRYSLYHVDWVQSSTQDVDFLRNVQKTTRLRTSRFGLPKVVGASGSDLGVIGRVSCKVGINGYSFNEDFLVCEYLKRPVILGIDFNRSHYAGVHWTKEGTRVLTINGKKISKENEHRRTTGAPVYTTQSVKIPPRSVGIIEVEINTNSKDKVKLLPDMFCQYSRPHMVMFPVYADLSKRKKGDIIPYQIFNISYEENMYLPKDFVVGFAEKDQHTGKVFEIECNMQEIEIDEIGCRNWIPRRKSTGAPRRPCRNKTNTDIHKIFSADSNFIKSPAEVNSRRKVNLQDQNITESTRQEFSRLCQEYDNIISKNSGDIG